MRGERREGERDCVWSNESDDMKNARIVYE